MTRRRDLDYVVAGASGVVALARTKAHLKRTGQWVDAKDRECREPGCKLLVADHLAPCRACGRAPEHHAEGDEALEWEGKARMAVARGRAGRPLTHADHEALHLFPDPGGWVGSTCVVAA